jgi:hypothetical protein
MKTDSASKYKHTKLLTVYNNYLPISSTYLLSMPQQYGTDVPLITENHGSKLPTPTLQNKNPRSKPPHKQEAPDIPNTRSVKKMTGNECPGLSSRCHSLRQAPCLFIYARVPRQTTAETQRPD